MSTRPADFNAQIIDEFRANEGRVGGTFEGTPLLLAAPHRRQVRQEPHQPARLPERRRALRRVRLEGRSTRRTPTGTTTSRPIPRSRSRWAPTRSRSLPARRPARSATASSARRPSARRVRRVREAGRARHPGDRADAAKGRVSAGLPRAKPSLGSRSPRCVPRAVPRKPPSMGMLANSFSRTKRSACSWSPHSGDQDPAVGGSGGVIDLPLGKASGRVHHRHRRVVLILGRAGPEVRDQVCHRSILSVGCGRAYPDAIALGSRRLPINTGGTEMTTSQLVTGVDFVGMPTRDLEAAVEFYGQTVGLPGRSTSRTATMPSSRRAT